VASFEVGVLSPAATSERDRRAGRLLRGDPPFDETNVRWRGPEFGIGDKFRLDQLDDPPRVSIEHDPAARTFFTHCTSDP
jgi:hypothetical protein